MRLCALRKGEGHHRRPARDHYPACPLRSQYPWHRSYRQRWHQRSFPYVSLTYRPLELIHSHMLPQTFLLSRRCLQLPMSG